MSDHQKSYYAVIPAFVRYHPDVSNGAKLLYGEITALCNERGYCWASNSYFANLYAVNVGTISRWIKELADAGFIEATVDAASGNQRQLRIGNEGLYQKNDRPISKNRTTSIEKSNDPISKNRTHNNTLNNTENNFLYRADESNDLDYPIADLVSAFPDVMFTPSQCDQIASVVKDTQVDREAWSATIDKYKLDYNPELNRYIPNKVSNLLGVFRSEKSRIERANGTNKPNAAYRKRTDAEAFAESAEWYANYPAEHPA